MQAISTNMAAVPFGNSHGVGDGDLPLDPSRCFRFDIDDTPPEAPRNMECKLRLEELQEIFDRPELVMPREVTVQIQELVRAEVLAANDNVIAKIEELERRITASCAAGPSFNKIQSGQGSTHEEVRGSLRSLADCDIENELSFLSEARQLDSWQFKGSCWDAVIFAFSGEILHHVDSAWMLLLVLVNFVMQSCFMAIVSLSLAPTSLNDETIDGYHLWRTNIGHDVANHDLLTDQSLASRVCSGDPSLHLSERQSNQVSHIRAYLDEHWPFNGPLLCLLALIAWILTVNAELQRVMGMIKAFRNLARGMTNTTSIHRSNYHLEVSSVSRRRIVFVCQLAALRAIIAIFLLFAGSKYLVVTISIEDILLNATALAFVLNIDELLYSAFVPRKTCRFISSLKPLPFGRSMHCFGLDASVCVTMILIVGYFVGIVHLVMLPEIASMREAQHELCGGAQTFVYAVPKSGSVVWADTAPTVSIEQTLKALQKSSRYKILRGVIDPVDVSSNVSVYKLGRIDGGGWTVIGMAKWSIQTTGEQLNDFCEDILNMSRKVDPITYFARSALRDVTANQSFASCEDARPYCNLYRGPGALAKMYCPVTCGCADAMSSLVAVHPSDGCPPLCKDKSRWKAGKSIAPCVDRSVYTPSGRVDSLWTDYLSSFRVYVSGWQDVYSRPFLEYAAELEKKGCQGVADTLAQSGMSLCLQTWVKPPTILCPETCQCNKTGGLYCPGTCAGLV